MIKEGEFVEVKYTGKIEGAIFDSNDPIHFKPEDQSKIKKLIIIVGQRFLVPGLDKALVDKEIGKKYETHVMPEEAFGIRNAQLVKTFPLKVFHEQKIDPQPGMTLMLDRSPVLVRSVSGARVVVDFNNPLAGKEVDYSFEIVRQVNDLKEKAEAFFQGFLRFTPSCELHENKIIIKGSKPMETLIPLVRDRFKELVGCDLEFREEKPASAPSENPTTQQSL